MTDTTTQKLITELRTLQQLTNTEAQIAQTRQAQARDEAVRDRIGDERGKRAGTRAADRRRVARAGRGARRRHPRMGRATALAKMVVEQGRPIAGALFGDLALEHQLLDRASYLEAFADTAGHPDTRNLARRLQGAHQETVGWITSVLVEEAAGEPAKVRPTPVQKAVGRLTSVINYPSPADRRMDQRDRRGRCPHPLTGRHRRRSRGRFLDRRARRRPASGRAGRHPKRGTQHRDRPAPHPRAGRRPDRS